MKSNKKEYHLQAKRKAYQEVNHPTGTVINVKPAVTAPAPPVVTAKKTTAVKVENKGQAAKANEVEVVSTETAEPEAVGSSAN